LGNGDGFTNLEVVQAARRITGHAIPCTVGDRRPGDPAILIASATKIRTELGWVPRYPTIDDIIGSAWEWHRTHPHGYRS
jgi:UDP-glucose 4-epimerase